MGQRGGLPGTRAGDAKYRLRRSLLRAVNNGMVTPINAAQRARVVSETQIYIERAAQIVSKAIPMLPVTFDLTGRACGMYRVRGRMREIRYNPYIFAKYFADNLAVTVPHEVAHYVVDRLYGRRKCRPHGVQWQALMESFGVDASRTANYDLSGIPLRTQRQFSYHCGCRQHLFSTRRHRKVARGESLYHCRYCRNEVRFEGQPVPGGGQNFTD